MGKAITRGVVRSLQTLWEAGAIGTLNDETLLERFLCGGGTAEAAFTALVERHEGMVLRVCRTALGDPHAARDATQATFLILAMKAGTIRRHESVASWLYGTARRVAKRERRDAERRRRYERLAAEKAVWGRTPCDDRDRAWPELHEELDGLAARYRGPIVLCDLGGMTHAEAARQLGCPLRTLQTRLYRGRERLRRRLIQRGLAPAAALVGSCWISGASAAHDVPGSITLAASAVRLARGTASWDTMEAISTAAAAMARAGLKGGAMANLKLTVAVGVLIGCVTSGSGLYLHRGVSAQAPQEGVSGRHGQKAPGSKGDDVQERAIAAIKELGGKVERAGTSSRPRVSVSFFKSRVTDEGLANLAGLKDVEALYLAGTRITDAGLRRLDGMNSLKGLEVLNLSDTQVTDAGLSSLNGLKNLLLLNLAGGAIAPVPRISAEIARSSAREGLQSR